VSATLPFTSPTAVRYVLAAHSCAQTERRFRE
jgi:hypothetical protein